MPKRYLLWVVLLMAMSAVRAQVVITLQLPPVGLTIKSQLWSLSVVNTSNQDIQAQVELSMVNVVSNQPVLTATTRIIDFPKGLKALHAGDVEPVTYNILTSGFNIDASPNGFLPVGTFELCYSVVKIDPEATERLAEECETTVIEPVSPPQLVNPSDSDYVDVNRPLFTWLPPAPAQLFASLSYDLNLVEVQPLQTGAEALEQNIPLETQGNLTTTSLQYPVSLPALDTGKLYAWQVSAKSGGAEVARSEVWTFRVKGVLPDSVKVPPVYYVRLKMQDDPGYSVCHGALYFAYLNEWNDKSAEMRLYDISAASRMTVKMDSSAIALRYGQNLCKLDFAASGKLQDKHVYLLELINSKGEHWRIKFEYR